MEGAGKTDWSTVATRGATVCGMRRCDAGWCVRASGPVATDRRAERVAVRKPPIGTVHKVAVVDPSGVASPRAAGRLAVAPQREAPRERFV
jgi:hypothetical protein